MKLWIGKHIPQQRIFWLAAAFTLALLIYEQIVLPFRVHDFLEVFSPGIRFLVSAVSIFLVVLYFWAVFGGGIVLRILALVIFIATLLTEYGYVYAMGRFSIIQDYEIGFTAVNAALIQNALLSYMKANLVALPPIAGLSACLILTRGVRDHGARRFTAVLAATLLFYSLLHPYCRGTFDSVSLGAGFRTLTFTGWKLITSYNGPRMEITYRAGQTPKNNIIFVVDESVRCDHLSINGYHRGTTLYLEQLQRQGLLTNWGKTAASATMSLNSNVYLLTGVTDMPDTRQNTRRVPTIFHYAKAAGYRTYHLDAQMDTPWLVLPKDQAVVDEWLKAKDLRGAAPETDIDFSAARRIHDIIHQSTGNFVWINKSGVHFPYIVRYPPEAEVWQPALKDSRYDYRQYQRIINSYDNAILYNLDRFFEALIGAEGLPDNTVIVYTADHGQTLSEHGESWPHSGNTPPEACVPLFIIQNMPPKVDTGYRASHANIFTTLLDLMNFPTEQRLYPYAPSLFTTKSINQVQRHYIFGTYDSYYGSAVYPFDP